MIIKHPLQVALIDDNEDLLMLLADYLDSDERYEVHQFTDPTKALDYMKDNEINIAVIDMHMDNLKGDQVLREIVSMRKGVQTVMITGDPSVVNFHTCFRVGANDFFLKPFTEEEFLGCIEERYKNLEKWNEQFKSVKDRRKAG